MTEKILTGKIVGISLGAVTLANVKYVRWRVNHSISPQLLPSSKAPVGWFQGHSYIDGELGLLSLSTDIVLGTGVDSTIMTPFRVTAETVDGTNVVYEFTGTIFANVDKAINPDTNEPVFDYHFMAYSVTET